MTEFIIDGKDTMTMSNMNQFEGHTGSAIHSIFYAASGAETAMTAKRDKFQLSTVGTAVHGAAKSGIATVNHFIDIFHLSLSEMKSMFNFFIIVL